MLTLRAHHLLCIQGYRGYGYSKNFTKNMNNIVCSLKMDTSIQVKIITKTDIICSCCPNNVTGKSCCYQCKVRYLDKKVLDLLQLEKDKVYYYKDLLNIIHNKITYESFKNICGICQWFHYGYCKKGLIANNI
ncbi:DUF1284 domain-containing protein [Clostridium ljungdahlii]|uniref:DUF1284 domain-containing protein n=1 Tax=Clostridium ljungdahlii TaxID=1538 RepID=UPI0009EE4748|nr:DUF1284 domain-containing protein [Clostridium ljungdahlii]